jgi:hypothetical protein
MLTIIAVFLSLSLSLSPRLNHVDLFYAYLNCINSFSKSAFTYTPTTFFDSEHDHVLRQFQKSEGHI